MLALAWLSLALPLIAAALAALPRTERVVGVATVVAAGAVLTCALAIMRAVDQSGTLTLVAGWVEIDPLAALLFFLVALVYTTAALFSIGYVSDGHSPGRTRLYYANFNLFVFSMLTIPLIAELGLVWIAVELTTLLSVLLVSFAGTGQALEAAWKYMVLTLLGATIAVLGILVLFWSLQSAGSTDFTWTGLSVAAHAMPVVLVKVAFVLVLVGYGAKIGLVPLHTWLPDAHSQAPSPVCALLSGIETSVVLYILLRLRGVFIQIPALHVQTWFAVLGLISAAVAVLLIVQTHDYKRLFAFSTVEHMGIVLVAASFATPLGDAAAVWQILAHTITKSFCFYAAGSTLLVTGTRSIAEVRGLFGTSKRAATALLIGALAISGAPPFAVFLSELAILRAGILAGQYLVTGILAACIAIGFFGVLFHAVSIAYGQPRQAYRGAKALPVMCSLTLAVAIVPIVLFGLWLPPTLSRLLLESASVLRL